MKLREQVGQLILIGLEGPELSALERAWLKLIRPSGVILFRRNIEQAPQIAALLRDSTEICGSPIFRCIDVEGGLVDRLRDLIAPMPSAAAVFATGKTAAYHKHGRLIAREIKAFGFNVTLAPVLDLALPASTGVMQSRVVSSKPSDVIAYAVAFLDGLHREGIVGCGKHFPGLGGGSLDSHKAMPVIKRSSEQLWSEDLAVFRALAAKLPMVMVAHAAYPAMEGRTSASISPFWISTVLKKWLRFRGLVISDDMEMGGILTQASIEDAAVKAVLAGTDLIEICRDPSLSIRAYEAILSEAEHSPAFRRRINKARRRIANFKNRNFDAGLPRSASATQIEKLRTTVKSFSEEIQ